MKKIILNFTLGCVFFIYSCDDLCGNFIKTNVFINRDRKVENMLSKITNEEFRFFVSHFSKKNPPLSVNCRYLNGFEIFTVNSRDTLKIERDIAIKYLCGGDEKLSKEPNGGLYEYYYGFRMPSEYFVCLLYFRPSVNYLGGYFLATFDFKGNLISNQIVAGDSLEKFQIESQILSDYKIKSVELSYSFPNVGVYSEIEAYQVNKLYKINNLGEIILQEEQKVGKVICRISDDGRLVIKH